MRILILKGWLGILILLIAILVIAFLASGVIIILLPVAIIYSLIVWIISKFKQTGPKRPRYRVR